MKLQTKFIYTLMNNIIIEDNYGQVLILYSNLKNIDRIKILQDYNFILVNIIKYPKFLKKIKFFIC